MSWLSSGLHAVGGLAEKAAPFVGMIPGIGTLAGGAIGGLGALAHGDGLGGALKYGAEGAAGGLGGGLLKGATAGAEGGGLMSTLAGLGKGALNYAVHNPTTLLAGAQTLNAANLGKKSNQYAENANNMANQSYAERAGLRSAGIEGLLHPQTPDTTALAGIRASNPYARPQQQLPIAAAA